MQPLKTHKHLLGGTLLIAGTTIGVGMLALPLTTGQGGFLPAVVIFVLAWIFMVSTGLLLLEVCTWMPKDANLISMAGRFFGNPGRGITWAVYLFFFFTVMIAHLAGGGCVIGEFSGGRISPALSIIIYLLLFSPAIYLGARSVDHLNLALMSGLILSYIAFITIAANYVDFSLLTTMRWSKMWMALPVLFTAFSYQMIIPTLVTYMKRDVKKVRMAIIIGTFIPLLIYLVWEFLILGIVPAEGAGSLAEAKNLGTNAVMPLRHVVSNSYLFTVGKIFAFFSMTTSYIGLALSFVDFLADGLKVHKKGMMKLILCLLVFIPPTVVAIIYPDIFLSALSYAGGICVAFLFGILPPLMVWVGRYYKKKISIDHPYQLPGGRALLAVLILFGIFVLILEVGSHFSIFSFISCYS